MHRTCKTWPGTARPLSDPITTSYRGIDVHEIGPNGQGITALMALNLMEGFDVAAMGSESAEYYHLVIEALRLAFADAMYFVTDPEFDDVPVRAMLSKAYASERRQVLDMDMATLHHAHGTPQDWSDTVYFCTADGDGNAWPASSTATTTRSARASSRQARDSSCRTAGATSR